MLRKGFGLQLSTLLFCRGEALLSGSSLDQALVLSRWSLSLSKGEGRIRKGKGGVYLMTMPVFALDKPEAGTLGKKHLSIVYEANRARLRTGVSPIVLFDHHVERSPIWQHAA